jgi:ACS family hexuronate transporter-like MFS transporter
LSNSSNLTPTRGHAWRWWICILLLLATMLNYMDRLTLNLMARRIMWEFRLGPRDYGDLESAFAFAFALGAIVFGWLADRVSVRWLYLVAVLGWSAAGFSTGLATGFLGLMMCRFVLGLFEAGNWPSALRTTQAILPSSQRAMGNGILQSGAALGAVLIPLIIRWLLTGADEPMHPQWLGTAVGSAFGHLGGAADQGLTVAASSLTGWLTPMYQPGVWRSPFLVVGGLGVFWIVMWFASVRKNDLPPPAPSRGPSLMSLLGWLILLLSFDVSMQMLGRAGLFAFLPDGEKALPWWLSLIVKAMVSFIGITLVIRWTLQSTAGDDKLPRPIFVRRFGVLIVLVIVMNLTWHFFRAWLPLYLQLERDYGEQETIDFFVAYYIATDLGSLAAGFGALLLVRWGFPVHGSRVAIYITAALLCTLSIVAARLDKGNVLLGVLLVIGFASLALFPLHYSFSQELTVRHQGKLSGALGCINWLAMYLLQSSVGLLVEQTKTNSVGVALAGLPPLLGVAALLFFWGKDPPSAKQSVSGDGQTAL